MKCKSIFWILMAVEAACVVWALQSTLNWYFVGMLMLVMALTLLLYFLVLRPVVTIEDGMNLLRSQDYASRLRCVGQSDADSIVGLFNDLMDRLKNERLTLEEKNLFLDQLIRASRQGIVIMDLDGDKIISSNPAADAMLKVIALPKLIDGESSTIRTSGGEVYRVIRESFIDRGFRHTFYIIESLTGEVYATQRDAYGKIIRIMAHEVNNTLGGIDSVMQTLRTTAQGDIAEAVDCCRESVANLSAFISPYTELVKLPLPNRQPMWLAASIERNMALFNALAGACGIEVEYDLKDSCVVEIDASQWYTVIINVVKNSVESIVSTGRHDGKITFSTGKDASLRITDNGAGISDADSTLIFTPFFTTKPQGHGIGLMLVSEILQRHGCAFSLVTKDGLTTFAIKFQDV